MLKISPEAKALIESRRDETPGHRWHLTVSWQKGAGDNSRAADGSAVWIRKPDVGWTVSLSSWPRWPEGAPEFGALLLPGVRLLVHSTEDHDFPGGEVVVREGRLELATIGTNQCPDP